MYMPAQIRLKPVKMVEIEPESDVPSTCPHAAGCSSSGGTASCDLMLWKYRPEIASDRDGEQIGVWIRQLLSSAL